MILFPPCFGDFFLYQCFFGTFFFKNSNFALGRDGSVGVLYYLTFLIIPLENVLSLSHLHLTREYVLFLQERHLGRA